ncbi:Uncharacterised protein [Bordetella pertussis]|nr:Uncharacterised protein [Bordetella pertussis]
MASRFSARLNGSRLLDPTVAHSSSMLATLPCNGRSQYSRISTPASARASYSRRAPSCAMGMSGSPCRIRRTRTPRAAAARRSRSKR